MIDISEIKKTISENKINESERIKTHKESIWKRLEENEEKIPEFLIRELKRYKIRDNYLRTRLDEFWVEVLTDIEYDYDRSDLAIIEFFKKQKLKVSITTNSNYTKMIRFEW